MNIQTDSRKIKPGDTFVALRGISSDGHQYIETAIKKGATTIIAEVGTYSVKTILVPDTRIYLTNYLKEEYAYLFQKLKLIGITGTNGKTTTAFLIHSAFHALHIPCAYIGTIGFYIDKKLRNLPNTTPDILELYELFLEAYDQGCEYVALEVSSQGIAYGRIDGISFDYVLFTNLTQDHLDFHKTMENYALAKQKLFYQLKPNGKAIINQDDSYQSYFVLPQNKNITYGFAGGDYQIMTHTMNQLGTSFTYRYQGKEETVKSPLLGDYNISNLLTAWIILKECGIKKEAFDQMLPRLQAPPGRMEKLTLKTNSIIIDYAHTPDAMEKLFSTVKELTKGKIYVVFGCTGSRDRLKRPIMADLATKKCSYAIFTSDDLHEEEISQIMDDMTEGLKQTNYEVCIDRKKAIEKGLALLKQDDVLLILGKGHEDVMIIKDQKIPFHDRTVVENYLKETKPIEMK